MDAASRAAELAARAAAARSRAVVRQARAANHRRLAELSRDEAARAATRLHALDARRRRKVDDEDGKS